MFQLTSILFVLFGLAVQRSCGQGAGGFDLGDHREGQLSGQISPLNVFAIVLGVIAAVGALSVTGVCAYFTYVRYLNDQADGYNAHPRYANVKGQRLI